MNRDFTISGMGHAIAFKKDVAQHVPPTLHTEAMRCGAVPVDQAEVEHVATPHKRVAEVQGDERAKKIVAAMDTLVAGNDRMSFGANGLPTIRAITRITGIELESNERDDLWQKRVIALRAVDDPSSATITDTEVAAAATATRERKDAMLAADVAAEIAAAESETPKETEAQGSGTEPVVFPEPVTAPAPKKKASAKKKAAKR